MPEWYARRSEGIGQVNGAPAEQAEAVAVAWRMHDRQALPAVRVGGGLLRDELAGPHGAPRRPRPRRSVVSSPRIPAIRRCRARPEAATGRPRPTAEVPGSASFLMT